MFNFSILFDKLYKNQSMMMMGRVVVDLILICPLILSPKKLKILCSVPKNSKRYCLHCDNG